MQYFWLRWWVRGLTSFFWYVQLFPNILLVDFRTTGWLSLVYLCASIVSSSTSIGTVSLCPYIPNQIITFNGSFTFSWTASFLFTVHIRAVLSTVISLWHEPSEAMGSGSHNNKSNIDKPDTMFCQKTEKVKIWHFLLYFTVQLHFIQRNGTNYIH